MSASASNLDPDTLRLLAELGLEQYCSQFEQHEIRSDVLPYITASDLEEIGVASIGHRHLISGRIRQLYGLKVEKSPDDRIKELEGLVAELKMQVLGLAGQTERETSQTPLGIDLQTDFVSSPLNPQPPLPPPPPPPRTTQLLRGVPSDDNQRMMLASTTEPFKVFKVSEKDTCAKVLAASLKRFSIHGPISEYRINISYGDVSYDLEDDQIPLLAFREAQLHGHEPVLALRRTPPAPVSLSRPIPATARRLPASPASSLPAQIVSQPLSGLSTTSDER